MYYLGNDNKEKICTFFGIDAFFSPDIFDLRFVEFPDETYRNRGPTVFFSRVFTQHLPITSFNFLFTCHLLKAAFLTLL